MTYCFRKLWSLIPFVGFSKGELEIEIDFADNVYAAAALFFGWTPEQTDKVDSMLLLKMLKLVSDMLSKSGEVVEDGGERS